jgi:hypothetical protein
MIVLTLRLFLKLLQLVPQSLSLFTFEKFPMVASIFFLCILFSAFWLIVITLAYVGYFMVSPLDFSDQPPSLTIEMLANMPPVGGVI